MHSSRNGGKTACIMWNEGLGHCHHMYIYVINSMEQADEAGAAGGGTEASSSAADDSWSWWRETVHDVYQ